MTLSKFYNADYYESHYGSVLNNGNYYHLLSQYWKYILFTQNGLNPEGTALDYGCGLGQVTASLPNVTYFDISSEAIQFLQNQAKYALENTSDIPKKHFDYLISSHSLEHYVTPANQLEEFHDYLKPEGKLILVLPIEVNKSVSLTPDSDLHFHAWTFQTITNLLCHCGWLAIHQAQIYNPFLLKTLGSKLSEQQAIKTSAWLGRLKKAYPSMLIIAQKHCKG
jgi:2-polyprenyl-3-methyl-5-hydroxy-6-metoxy-1,4-benzoquinol methylase